MTTTVPGRDMLQERIRHLGADVALEAIEQVLDWQVLTDADRVALVRDILAIARTARRY